MLTNARSLIKNTDSLNGFLIDSKTNIAFVTETWITNNNAQVIKSKFNKDYRVLSALRGDKGGGGVTIFVAKSYAMNCAPLQPKQPVLPAWLDKSKKESETMLPSVELKIVKIKVHQLPRE